MYQLIKSMVSLANHLITPSHDQRRSANKSGPLLESLEGRKLMSAGMQGPFGTIRGQGHGGGSRGGNGHGRSAHVGLRSQAQAATTATPTSTATTTTATAVAADSTNTTTAANTTPNTGNQNFPGGMFGGLDQGGGGGPMMGGGGGGGMMDGGKMGRHRGGAGGQNEAGGSGTNASATTGTTAADTKLQADFTKLRTDMQTIQDKSQVTPALMAKVRKDFEAIAKANPSLDVKTIGKPADTSSTTPPTFDQHLADIKTALTNAKVSQDLIDPLVADMTAVNTASGVTADDLKTIQADHDAIKADSPTQTAAQDHSNTSGGNTQNGFRSNDGPGGHGMWA